MLTKTQEKILCFLLGSSEEKLSIRGIARRLKLSYPLTYNNIAVLEKQGIIQKQNIAPAQIVTLNNFAPVDVFIEVELKRRSAFLQKQPWIRVMLEDILNDAPNAFFTLIVFGSYAKNTETPKSDLDLLVIVQNKKEIDAVESSIKRVYTKVKKNIIVCDVIDFREMIINPNVLTVGNEAKKAHIVLYGIEEYYRLIIQA